MNHDLMLMIKSENINGNGKRLAGPPPLGPSETGEMVKCVRRRRRDPPLPPVTSKDQSSTGSTIKRSSRFRGVSRHRWTGRYEAHLWDKGSWNATQKKKGKQVYLGAYDEEEAAARAYDLAALKYWGPTTFTNFPVSDYEKELQIMQNVTKEEYLASLRRKSSGFSRGVSRYRGVARHHHNGRWEARIGRVFGNKYLYLGTYSTQEEAAHAYDIAAIEYRGINAVTNFDLSTYIRWLRPGYGGANSLMSPQEKLDTGTHNVNVSVDASAMRNSDNSYVADGLEVSLCKQEFFTPHNQLLFPGSSNCSYKASPTALSLLLRSSMFRELVEKNAGGGIEENEAEIDTKERVKLVDHNQYNYTSSCISVAESGTTVDTHNRNELYYNGSEQSLWN